MLFSRSLFLFLFFLFEDNEIQCLLFKLELGVNNLKNKQLNLRQGDCWADGALLNESNPFRPPSTDLLF